MSYDDGTNSGKYDVPGGRIEISETLGDALSREVLEEVGLKIKSYELVDVQDTFNEKRGETWHIVRLFYKVECEEGEVKLSKDHDDFKWVSLEKVKEFPDIIENLLLTFAKLKK